MTVYMSCLHVVSSPLGPKTFSATVFDHIESNRFEFPLAEGASVSSHLAAGAAAVHGADGRSSEQGRFLISKLYQEASPVKILSWA